MPKRVIETEESLATSLKLPEWTLNFFARYLGKSADHAGYAAMVQSAIRSYVKTERPVPMFSLWPGECARGKSSHLSGIFVKLGLTSQDFLGRTVKFEKADLERWMNQNRPRVLLELRGCLPKKHYLLAALDHKLMEKFEEQANYLFLEQSDRIKSLTEATRGLKSELSKSGKTEDPDREFRLKDRIREARELQATASQVLEVLRHWGRHDGNAKALQVIAALLQVELIYKQEAPFRIAGLHDPRIFADFLRVVNEQNLRLSGLHLDAI
jgi:hypothetical protein